MNTSLAEELYDIQVVKLGSFTLKSGMQSPIYIDLRQLVSHPKTLRNVAESMWQQIQSIKTDLICGVPYTALPIATCLSLDHNIPMVMQRKETKDYGTKKRIEGAFQKGQTCIVIEDVITTGGSALQTAKDLEQEGLIVKDIIAFLDREQGGKENIDKAGYQLHTACNLSDLLTSIKQTVSLNPEEMKALEELAL